MRVTQKDIARRLGLSPSLVSRALSGTADRIGADPDTVRGIRQEANALGYVPNAAARQLRGTGQPVIGVVAADLEDPFFGPAVAEVIRQSHHAGFALTITGFDHRTPSPTDAALLLQHDLKALILLGSGSVDWIQPFIDRHVRVIRIGAGPGHPALCEIAIDEREGIDLLVRHLIELGHREIAFIGARQPAHARRLDLVREVLRRYRLKLPPAHAVVAAEDVLEAGLSGIEHLARSCGGNWPTAVVASSDAVAMGVLRGAAMHGLRVPDHLSVTGFDDLALARLTTPPLTSVRQPIPDMVKEALRRAVKARPGSPPPPHHVRLVVRGSTTAAWSG